VPRQLRRGNFALQLCKELVVLILQILVDLLLFLQFQFEVFVVYGQGDGLLVFFLRMAEQFVRQCFLFVVVLVDLLVSFTKLIYSVRLYRKEKFFGEESTVTIGSFKL
jgi:hypothetical protein